MSKAETQTLYDGSVILERDGRHRYRLVEVGGEPVTELHIVPSSTGITGQYDKSRFLIWWAVRVMKEYLADRWLPEVPYSAVEISGLLEEGRKAHSRKKDTAAAIGTLVHDHAERRVRGYNALPQSDPAVIRGVAAFDVWWNKQDWIELRAERFLYSHEHNYTGQADGVGILRNQPDKFLIFNISVVERRGSIVRFEAPVRRVQHTQLVGIGTAIRLNHQGFPLLNITPVHEVWSLGRVALGLPKLFGG